MPQVIGVPLFVLSALRFLKDVFPGIGKRLSFSGKGKATSGSAGTGNETSFSKGKCLFIAWKLLFVFLMCATGVIASIVIAFFIYLNLLVKQSWMLSIVYSAVFAAAVYLIFVDGMGVYDFTSPDI